MDLLSASEQSRVGLLIASITEASELHDREPGGVDNVPAESNPARQTRRPQSFLDAHLTISLITQKPLASLYAPRNSSRSHNEIQSAINE